MGSRTIIGEFVFDPSTGDVIEQGVSKGRSSRLAPQPSQLLSLLIVKPQEILTHEEIREHLWPGIRVDFEQSTHHCIRQIRAALGDRANQPSYVETIPRRGYRFIAPVSVIDNDANGTTEDVSSTPQRDLGDLPVTKTLPDDTPRKAAKGKKSYRWIVWALMGLAVLLIAWLTFTGFFSGERPTRVAVMTFEIEGAPPNAIAESIVEHLFRSEIEGLEVIGPTTTESFEGRTQPIRALFDDLQIEYVINGRLIRDEGGERYLAEIIRSADGAHVWVENLGGFPLDPDIAATISFAFLRVIGKEASWVQHETEKKSQ